MDDSEFAAKVDAIAELLEAGLISQEEWQMLMARVRDRRGEFLRAKKGPHHKTQ